MTLFSPGYYIIITGLWQNFAVRPELVERPVLITNPFMEY
jgi:hypothetical protein